MLLERETLRFDNVFAICCKFEMRVKVYSSGCSQMLEFVKLINPQKNDLFFVNVSSMPTLKDFDA